VPFGFWKPSPAKGIVITNTAQTTWTVPDDWNNLNNSIQVIGGGGGKSQAGGVGAQGVIVIMYTP
jgi:hypothetical protein